MTDADLAVVAAVLAASFAVAVGVRRRSGGGVEAYFVAGRSLPWWLAGTSMVATTFGADTPLAVTELVAEHGLAGNWLWWSQALGGLLTVFFFARLWRRAGVMTDAEFAELRYSGRPAAFLRGFRAFYLAVPVNLIVMGWVNLAMASVLQVSLGLERGPALWTCFALTAAYSTLAGIWGVVAADFLQFLLAMSGCVALAAAAVARFGGLAGLREAAEAAGGPGVLSLLPSAGSGLPLAVFLTYLGVAWWASWYPGAEPGGGGYVAQRIFSTKDDRHAVGASLWFAVAHYAVRPWPWLLVALASLSLYPGLERPGEGFPRAMMDLLPSPWKGFMLAAFAAAYMSTLSTHLNWGASYLVGDLYRRFLRPGRSEAHYLAAARLASVGLALASVAVTGRMTSVAGAWRLLISLGAGCGAVYLLRWYWWRINAWSEVAAMAGAAAFSLGLSAAGVGEGGLEGWARHLLWTTAGTTAVWLAATWLTAPEPPEVLRRFYRKVAPAPAGWGPVAGTPTEHPPIGLRTAFFSWLLGCVFVYACLFAVGGLLLGRPWLAVVLSLAALLSGAGLLRLWDKP